LIQVNILNGSVVGDG